MIKPDEASSIGIDYTVTAEPETPQPADIEALPPWKRALDVTLIMVALPILVPISLLIAMFIKIVSPGPALFRQQRVGIGGKRFMCLKFRTMKVNADTNVHQSHLKQLITSNRPTKKLDGNDKRLIPGGLFLRALGVDELPQLINILRGEMSLVGPRPCTPFEFDLFSDRHKRRCLVPPGLTGLWQVSGKNKTTFEEQMGLDLYYVEHKSVWLDVKIVVMTIPAILFLVWETKWRPGKVIPVPQAQPSRSSQIS